MCRRPLRDGGWEENHVGSNDDVVRSTLDPKWRPPRTIRTIKQHEISASETVMKCNARARERESCGEWPVIMTGSFSSDSL